MPSAKTAAVFLSAAAVRLALAPFFGHSWDVYVWLKSGELFYNGVNVYEIKSLTDFPWGFYAYPPVWLYWVGLVHYLTTSLNNLNLHLMLIKTPIIAADLIVAVLIAKLAVELGMLKDAGRASLLWLFNPLVISISAVWGMFDSIAVAFCLAGVLAALRGSNFLAGVLLGLGGAVKIYPLLILVPTALFLRYVRKRSLNEVFKTVLGTAVAFALPMLPFLQNPLPILDKLLYHFGNVGSFTYWTVLSVISPPPAVPLLSQGLFIILLYITLRKQLKNNAGLAELSQASLLAFLATSAKVNVQYVLWVLPFLILYALRKNSREFRINVLVLIVGGLLFVVAAQAALAIFDLRNLGKIVVSKEVESATLGGMALIVSAVIGGTRFITLFLNILREGGKALWSIQRIAIISILLMFVFVVGLFPAGQGVVAPRTSVRVGVMEGVEALYSKSDEYDSGFLVSKYNLTHIVIPIGPDGILYDGDYSKSFRFKLTNDEWRQNDLRKLADSMRRAGVKPLLGVYLKAYHTTIHYGYHGYNSSHLIENFPECIDGYGNINFQCTPSKILDFADYFSQRIVDSAISMGFEGVYIMGVGWDRGVAALDSLLILLKNLIVKSRPYGLHVFLEFDPMSYKNPLTFMNSAEELLNYVDYVVLVTNPFLRSVKGPAIGNYTTADFKRLLEKAVEMSSAKRARVLFTINVMDIAEGWMTPAIQLQTEINEFSTVKGVAGYAVYHVSRYLPVKISVK
ncbi:MAG: hypothetical protein QXR26_02810 [Candidatus Caldarchaeum sp.]